MDIKYSKQAEKFLKRQDEFTRNRIIRAIHKLPAGDIKKLRNSEHYRLRVGSFRIIFDQNGNILYIIRIDNRGDVYK